jgi:hypothetical protein
MAKAEDISDDELRAAAKRLLHDAWARAGITETPPSVIAKVVAIVRQHEAMARRRDAGSSSAVRADGLESP